MTSKTRTRTATRRDDGTVAAGELKPGDVVTILGCPGKYRMIASNGAKVLFTSVRRGQPEFSVSVGSRVILTDE